MKEQREQSIRLNLARLGYAVVSVAALNEFHLLCNRIGRVTQTRDVRIVSDGTQYPELPDAVPYHTDHPEVPVVAWYCVRQDDDQGATMLVDARRVMARLTAETIEALERFNLPLIRSSESVPLLRMNPFHVYWLPVFVERALETASEAVLKAVAEFRKVLNESHARDEVKHVRLRAGEALFVDNQVILHGRESIPPSSTRHLVRNYLAH